MDSIFIETAIEYAKNDRGLSCEDFFKQALDNNPAVIDILTRCDIVEQTDYKLAKTIEGYLGSKNPISWDKVIGFMKRKMRVAVFRFSKHAIPFEECVNVVADILCDRRKNFLEFCAEPTKAAVLCMAQLFPLSMCLWLRAHNKGTLKSCDEEDYNLSIAILSEDDCYETASQEQIKKWFPND